MQQLSRALGRRGIAAAALLLIGAAACAADDPTVTAPAGAALDARYALAPSSTPAPLVNGGDAALCAAVSGNKKKNGTPLVLASCNGAASQAFAFLSNGEVHVYGDICVQSTGLTGRDGDAETIWRCVNGANQKWSYTAASEIRGLNSLCVAPASGAVAGSRLVLRSCDGSTAQKWTVPGGSAAPPADTTPAPAPAPTPAPTPSSTRWVSGYYVGYQRSLYPETSIDFSVMTHVIVGRITPTASGGVTATFDIDATNGPIMAKNVSSRAHAAGRKAILMVGGAGEHADFVSAASSANRATFERNLLAAMDSYGYDGLDIDWEPIETADQAPLLQLLKDLRAARPTMILTIPVGWVGSNSATPSTWYAQVASVVDQMNVMSYEMAGNWGGWVSWHSSALDDAASNHPSSIKATVNGYRAAGVPAGKLGIGIGAYGSCWRGPTAPRQGTGSGVVASDNTMSYATIVSQYYDASARQWDAAASVPYLSYASGKGAQGCNFISYDDEQSVTAKGSYVKSQGLGGTIIWTIGEGHLSSAPVGQQDPLLKAAYTSIAP